MKPLYTTKERERLVSINLVEFTNARTNSPVWVNPTTFATYRKFPGTLVRSGWPWAGRDKT
jgi:hypothetical protein